MPPFAPPPKKRQVFFVDTKTTCFLCLQGIVPEPPPPPVSLSIPGEAENNDGQRNGDTPWGETVVKVEKQEPFCLRGIFKLLQLDPGSVISKKLTAGPFLGSNLANTDLSVTLCGKCLGVSGQLSNLFREWEVVQMKLDNALQNFGEILKNSEKTPELMAALQGQLFDPLDVLQGSITALMRKEALEKCTKHLERTFPKVRLIPQTIVPRTATVAPAPCSPPPDPIDTTPAPLKYICDACGNKYKLQTSLTRHKKLQCKFRPGAPAPPPPAPLPLESLEVPEDPQITMEAVSVEELLSSMPRIKAEDGSYEQLLCNLCPSLTDSKFLDVVQLKEHIFTTHPSHFFTSARLSEGGQSQFQAWCAQLLENDWALISSSALQDPFGSPVFPCAHCCNQYPDKWSMYTHLVQDHYPVYAAKLLELQTCSGGDPWDSSNGSDPVLVTTELPPDTPAKPKSSTNLHHCSDCGKQFFCQNSIYRHKNLYCPNRSTTTPPKAKPSTDPEKRRHCNVCGKQLANPASVWRHRKYACPYRHFIDTLSRRKGDESFLGTEETPPNIEPPSAFKCDACLLEYPLLTDLRDHIAVNHAAKGGSHNQKSRGLNGDPVASPASVPRHPGSLPSEGASRDSFFNGDDLQLSALVSSALSLSACPDCGKYLKKTSVPRHKKSTCPYASHKTPTLEQNFHIWKCQSTGCPKEFQVHHSLRLHVSSGHPEKRKCGCGDFFPDLLEHIKERSCFAHQAGGNPPRSLSPPLGVSDLEDTFFGGEEEEAVDLFQISDNLLTKITVLEPTVVQVGMGMEVDVTPGEGGGGTFLREEDVEVKMEECDMPMIPVGSRVAPSSDGPFVQCDVCEKSILKVNMPRHKKRYCQKKKGTSAKGKGRVPPTPVPFKPYLCEGCCKPLTTKYWEQRHKKLNCVNRDILSLLATPPPPLPSEDGTAEPSKPFKCRHCSKRFSSQNGHWRHVHFRCVRRKESGKGKPLREVGVRNRLSNCNICGKDFSNGSYHPKCPYRAFMGPDYLRAKRKGGISKTVEAAPKLEPPPTFQCHHVECPFEAPQLNELRVHIVRTHLQEARPDGKPGGGICECGEYFNCLKDHISRKTCSAHRHRRWKPKGTPPVKSPSPSVPPPENVNAAGEGPSGFLPTTFSHTAMETTPSAVPFAPPTPLVYFAALEPIEPPELPTFYEAGRDGSEAVNLNEGSYVLHTETPTVEPSLVQFLGGPVSDGGMEMLPLGEMPPPVSGNLEEEMFSWGQGQGMGESVEDSDDLRRMMTMMLPPDTSDSFELSVNQF